MRDAVYSLGVMTGTSCDGADAALLAIREGDRGAAEDVAFTMSAPFPEALRRKLRAAQRGGLGIKDLGFLETEYSDWIAEFCSKALKRSKAPRSSTLCAAHGQTIWHEPPHFSMQLLEPSRIAVRTGLTTVARFRQPDLALGGQGAPLAPYYHWLRGAASGLRFPFAIQNLGGISNLTVVTKNKNGILAFDTGPSNALIDLAAQRATKGRLLFDENGAIARSALSEVDWGAVERIARHPYFRKKPPKSTGRELFNEAFLKRVPGSGAAKVANATALTAHTIASAYRDFVLRNHPRLEAVYVAGGGAKNGTLLALLRSEMLRVNMGHAMKIAALPECFGPATYLEAMAFARLGYEALLGREVSLACVTGARKNGVGAAIIPGENYRQLLQRVRSIQEK